MQVLKKFFRNFAADQRGQALVMVAAAMVALVGFTALVTDIGLIVANRQQLVNTMDAAALAGAQELPDNPAQAVQAARDYAEKNNYDPSKLNVSISGDNTTISVSGDKDVNMTFAKVLGIDTKNVSAISNAQKQALNSCTGLAPLTINELTWADLKPGDYCTLKGGAPHEPSQFRVHGNFGIMDLDPPDQNGHTRGANVYEDYLANGYNEPIKVGEWRYAEPGNKAGKTKEGIEERIKGHEACTLENHEPGCKRIITIPIHEYQEISGRKLVKIIGFASFFVVDTPEDDEIAGRFIETVQEGDASPTQENYGVCAVRLIKD